MNNPFRSQLWQQTIRNENKLYPSEFCMSMTDSNGTFVRLSEINEMIVLSIFQYYHFIYF